MNLEKVITCKICQPKCHVVNTLALILKQYIYRQRCLKELVNFVQYKAIVRNMRNIEKYVAMKNDKLYLHERKWDCKIRIDVHAGNDNDDNS